MMLNTSPGFPLHKKEECGQSMGLDKFIFSLILELRVVNASHDMWSGYDLSRMCEDLPSPHHYLKINVPLFLVSNHTHPQILS